MKWTIVAFRHPAKEKSLVYLQDLSDEKLLDKIQVALRRGANLISIRGFDE